MLLIKTLTYVHSVLHTYLVNINIFSQWSGWGEGCPFSFVKKRNGYQNGTILTYMFRWIILYLMQRFDKFQ